MKLHPLLLLVGGIVAAVAFFLPFRLTGPDVGFFGPGTSQLDSLVSALQYHPVPGFELYALLNSVISLLEPLGALALIVSSFFAFRGRRAAYAWGAGGAVLGLTYLLVLFTTNYALTLPPTPRNDLSYWPFSLRLGGGYWLAAIGLALGVISALLGWLAAIAPAAPSGNQALRFRPGALLILVGGLAVAVGYFLPDFPLPGFPPFAPDESLFASALQEPSGYLVIWPYLLTFLLLLGCSPFALLGQTGASLWGLVAALVGLTFLLLRYGPLEALAPADAPPYWVALIGCALALIGSLLGLLARPAPPTPSYA